MTFLYDLKVRVGKLVSNYAELSVSGFFDSLNSKGSVTPLWWRTDIEMGIGWTVNCSIWVIVQFVQLGGDTGVDSGGHPDSWEGQKQMFYSFETSLS